MCIQIGFRFTVDLRFHEQGAQLGPRFHGLVCDIQNRYKMHRKCTMETSTKVHQYDAGKDG